MGRRINSQMLDCPFYSTITTHQHYAQLGGPLVFNGVVVVGTTGHGHNEVDGPRINTAVPLGASRQSVSHSSEFDSDSEEEYGGDGPSHA